MKLNQESAEMLDGIFAGGGSALSIKGKLGSIINAAIDRIVALEALSHTQNTDSYSASELDNDSAVVGDTIKDALETLNAGGGGGSGFAGFFSTPDMPVLEVGQWAYWMYPFLEGQPNVLRQVIRKGPNYSYAHFNDQAPLETPIPGVAATLELQKLSYVMVDEGVAGNTWAMVYSPHSEINPGEEYVQITGPGNKFIEVIMSETSSSNQVKAAIQNSVPVSAIISVSGGDDIADQHDCAPTFFTGGIDPTATALLNAYSNIIGAAGIKTITGDGIQTCAELLGVDYTVLEGGDIVLKNGESVTVTNAAFDYTVITLG